MSDTFVFIGGIWLPEEEKNIIKKSKGSVQYAANILQTALISGFDSILDNPITILNGKFIGAFPKRYKQLVIKSRVFNHSKSPDHLDYEIGFLNLPVYKHISKYLHSKRYIRKHCNANKNGKTIVIGYSMTQSVVNELCYVKRVNPEAKTCLIVPDLPEFMNFGPDRGPVFRALKAASSKEVYRKIQKIDSFVVLTDYMYKRLGVSKPYIVIEGVAKEVSIDEEDGKDTIRTIVYTGSLSIKHDICELVDAFGELNEKDIRLVICGSGDGQHYVEEKAKKDDRIIYKGNVSSIEARKIQRDAYILVNPRKSKDEYTKYSFPSKTMEYMLSGRPVIMYKLDGIPDEYDPYLIYVKDDILTTMKSVLCRDSQELDDFGQAAREFVLKEKNQEKQATRIYTMLKTI